MTKATANTPPADTSDELAKYTGFTREELKGITSFEDVERLFRERGETVDSASDAIGDGFALLDREQKDRLIDVPVMFVSWVFVEGDYGRFVSARVLCREPNGSLGKYVINDGSTGILRDLDGYSADNDGKQGGLFAQKGLTRSDYEYLDEATGERKPASTYYINTSA